MKILTKESKALTSLNLSEELNVKLLKNTTSLNYDNILEDKPVKGNSLKETPSIEHVDNQVNSNKAGDDMNIPITSLKSEQKENQNNQNDSQSKNASRKYKKTSMEELIEKAKLSQTVIVEILFSVLDFLLKHVNPKLPVKKAYEEINQKEKTKASLKKSSKEFSLKEKLRKINLESINNSMMIERLIHFMSVYASSFKDFSILILEVLRDLATDEKLAKKLSRKGALEVILDFLTHKRESLRSYEVNLGFEVLWNCLSRTGRKAIQNILKKECVVKIQSLFIIVLAKAYKLEDKCLRNELMILLCYILDDSPYLAELFISNKFVDPMISLDYQKCKSKHLKTSGTLPKIATKKELRSSQSNMNTQVNKSPKINENSWRGFENLLSEHSSIAEILFYLATCDEHPDKLMDYFDSSQEDLQFKLLVYYSIGILLRQSFCSKDLKHLISKYKFVDSVMYHVQIPFIKKFSEPQRKEIENEILKLLAGTIELIMDDFILSKGSGTLLKYMVFSKDPHKKILCLKIFLALSEINDTKLINNFDCTLVDHVIDNVSFDIDLNCLEDIGKIFNLSKICFLNLQCFLYTHKYIINQKNYKL